MNLRSKLMVLVAAAAVVAGAAGYFAGRGLHRGAPAPGGGAVGGAPTVGAAPVQKQVFTCSMHPQVRLDGPGMCPICDMPLVSLGIGADAGKGPPSLQLSEHALAMAGVETTLVSRRKLSRALRAVGKIQYNESSLANVTARVDGYAERLFVNFTGVVIKAGDHLAEIYSPELLVAQQELLIALQAGDGSSPLIETSRLKLRRWGLTDQQIKELIESRRIADRVTLYSPITGTVIEKSILENSAFKAGDALYRVANLDTVWAYIDIYELDFPWVRYGQQVQITAEAYPGRTFRGMVTFVQPIVNEETRTIRVPVHVENADHALKPGMFVSASIQAELGPDGLAAPTGVEGRFSCPMHPQVLRDEAGACPICEMPLERIPAAAHSTPLTAAAPLPPSLPETAPVPPAPSTPRFFCPMKCEGEETYDQPGPCPVCNMKLKEVPAGPAAPASGSEVLAVPVSAVLDSGTRQIVYIEKSQGLFEPRELALGPRAGEYFAVLAGLSGGERVVTRGNFLIDSQFQVTGHPSLFYPGGLHASMGHQHGAPAAPGGANTPAPGGGGAPPPPTSDKSPPTPPPRGGAPAGHKH